MLYSMYQPSIIADPPLCPRRRVGQLLILCLTSARVRAVPWALKKCNRSMLVVLLVGACCCRCKDRVHSLWSTSEYSYVQYVRTYQVCLVFIAYLILYWTRGTRYSSCSFLFTCSAWLSCYLQRLLALLFNVLTVAKRDYTH